MAQVAPIQSFQDQHTQLRNVLKGVIGSFKTFVYGGFDKLPLTIAGTFLVLGLCTSNYTMLLFLSVYLIIVPFLGDVLDFLLPLFFEATNISVAKSISAKNIGMITFFISYLYMNASYLSTYKMDDSSPNDKKDNRKNTVKSSIAYLSIFSFIVFCMEIYKFGSDNTSNLLKNIVLLIIIIGIFISITYAYFYSMRSNSVSTKYIDLFGISHRILQNSALEEQPLACFPVPPTVIPNGGTTCPPPP
jgi:hypothetical protein